MLPNTLAMKAAIGGVLILSTFFMGFGSGYIVQGWKKDASYAEKINTAQTNYHNLELSTEKQNSGIQALNYQLAASRTAQEQAERSAKYIRNQYDQQTKRVESLEATTCIAMINDLKGK